MATVPSALRKQLDAAEKCFADGNLRSSKMHVDMAAALFGSVPEAQRAQAAYKVHAAAAAATKDKLGKPDHYAVLGVKINGGKPDRSTHDAVRKQHKELRDLLGPAKDSSAAVAAAYKLVDEAFSALTDIKKGEVAASPSLKPSPPLWQQQAARRKAQKQLLDEEEAEEDDDDYYGGSGTCGRRRRAQTKDLLLY